MAQKPSIPKGTRDFLPAEVAKRNYIFDTIKKSFETYGFSPIETPSFELSSTLLGKYGEEGDRLIFRILNSGDFLRKQRSKIENYNLLKGWIALSVSEVLMHLIKSENLLYEIQNDYLKLYTGDNYQNRVYNDTDWSHRNFIDLLRREELKNELFGTFIERFSNLISTSENISSNVSEAFNKTFQDDHVLDHILNYVMSLEFQPFNEGEKPKNYEVFVDELSEILVNKAKNVLAPDGKTLAPLIAEKALRYDLTVPFARFVVQHQNELAFPFKRYQIQPVWRADRPQHGRYQEFYQCDADVVGSDSLLYEVDFVLLFDEVLTNLNLPDFTIKINNRKILSGIAEVCGESDKLIQITVAIDKLDKVGVDGVIKELIEKGVAESAIDKIKPLFEISGDTASRLEQMKAYLAQSEIGLKGVEELTYVLDQVNELGLKRAKVEFDVTLARGLNYYTGAIFEVKANGVKMGSICGGGRYDDLTGIFGMKDMSGVGISFGADRIYDVLNELELFPESVDNRLDVLFINFGPEEEKACLKLVKKLRDAGVSAEVYPTSAKMNKQMKYANARGVKNTIMLGANEIASGEIQIKNMDSGEQTPVFIENIVSAFKK